MLNFLPAPLIGIIASLLLALNALFWVPILLCIRHRAVDPAR
jgi:hypothetical protein